MNLTGVASVSVLVGRMRQRVGLLALTVAGLVLVPPAALAEAPPLTGTINAVDTAWKDPATGKSSVVIAPGGTVDFSYPSGGTSHNVVFSGAAPTSCTQTAGANSGAVPPLPATPTSAGWAGNCKFDAEGTYAFVCGLHSFMKGSVVVSATLPPPDDGTGPGSGGGGGGGGAGGGAGTGQAAAASKLVVARVQRGGAVRGSVVVAGGGSRLTVELLARRAALGGGGKGLVGVGRLSKAVGAGKRGFAVNLSGAAKRAVGDAERLALTVRVRVRPADGAAFAATRAVVVKAG